MRMPQLAGRDLDPGTSTCSATNWTNSSKSPRPSKARRNGCSRFDCETCTFNEHLTEFPGQNSYNGSEMSIGPEGNIYIRSRIRLASEGEDFHGGVMVLSPTFEELGWTGGNTPGERNESLLDQRSPVRTGGGGWDHANTRCT